MVTACNEDWMDDQQRRLSAKAHALVGQCMCCTGNVNDFLEQLLDITHVGISRPAPVVETKPTANPVSGRPFCTHYGHKFSRYPTLVDAERGRRKLPSLSRAEMHVWRCGTCQGYHFNKAGDPAGAGAA